MTDTLPLPRVTVHRGDTQLGEFWGADAEAQAQALMQPGEEYSLSICDERCSACGEVFWHEARDWDAERHAWVCPACDGDPIRESHA